MPTSAPTTHFGKLLAEAQRGHRQAPKQWLFVAYDQLNVALGPMATVPPKDLGLIFIETTWKPRLRDYHKQKLALLLTNMRHFALEQAQRGHTVRYIASRTSYGETLAGLGRTLGPIDCITPAEHELRCDIAEHVRFVPHNGWLSDAADFARLGAPPWRMEAFYKHMRRKLGIMMDGPQPRGGKWSFDADNRKRWPGTPPAPTPPTFAPDAITREVCALVQAQFGNHFGVLRPEALPASLADAAAAWDWAQTYCLPLFGPYEDAMSQHSATLFHTLISPLLNLQRLQARQVVDAALSRKDVPLASLEGFIRQIIGWREFVHHVHTHTDGLQRVPTNNALRATLPLPPAYWGTPSGMNCLDTVVQNVVEHGYSHHITRLMVLSNIATLIAADPRALTDWFWFAYIDAYDWVVEPNVLGMGTFALGDLMITKPYVSGAAYINKMSDYCKGCAFNPAKNCPITPMYWAFLVRHQGSLKDNHRMAIPLMGLQRREPGRRDHDARIFAWVQQELTAGRVLTPEGIPTP